MSGILDILSGAIGNDTVEKIGSQLGIDSGTTSTIVNAALPLLLSALAKNSSSQQGAEALHNAVTKDHDGSILDNIGGLLGGAVNGNGGGILGHILGNKRDQIQQGLGASTGVDGSTVGSVLELLAPVVMGAIGRQTASQGLDAGGLAGMLKGAAQGANKSSPDLMGSLLGMLDTNKDGNVVDDVAGMLGKLFNKS